MVREIRIDDAREFVDHLRPYSSNWRPKKLQDARLTNPTGWVFRGKRNAAWSLRPKALRPGNMDHYAGLHLDCDPGPQNGDRITYLSRHALSELEVVAWFPGTGRRSGHSHTYQVRSAPRHCRT